MTNCIHTCNLLVFVSIMLQNFYTEDQSFKSRPQQNEHVFIYNIISKECCHTISLVFLFSNFNLKLFLKNSRSNTLGITYLIIYLQFREIWEEIHYNTTRKKNVKQRRIYSLHSKLYVILILFKYVTFAIHLDICNFCYRT